MRELLRTIRNPQTAEYLSEVIDAVVPLEDDVSLVHFCSLRISSSAVAVLYLSAYVSH